MRLTLITLLAALIAGPALASDFQRVKERDSFLSLVSDRDLTRVGIRVKVTRDGKIMGRAFGWRITGDWRWSGGYFCRDLYYNDNELDMKNCQLVQVSGDTLRFTSDKGRGDSADLRLR